MRKCHKSSLDFTCYLPCLKAPPWIHNKTGSFALLLTLVVQTFKYKQSSLHDFGTPKGPITNRISSRFCHDIFPRIKLPWQLGYSASHERNYSPKDSKDFSPFHIFIGFGGMKRLLCVGGSAYGIPRKLNTGREKVSFWTASPFARAPFRINADGINVVMTVNEWLNVFANPYRELDWKRRHQNWKFKCYGLLNLKFT